MPPTIKRGLLRLLVAGLCIALCDSSVRSQDQHEGFWKMLQTVQDILAGKNLEQATRTISPGATLICGSRMENLRSVVEGEAGTCALADSSFHGIAVQGRTNSSEDMGFIVLKTVKADTTVVRYHTVVFLKDSAGDYKISTWHAGDGRE
jgi:hypothetical protein